MNIKEKMEIAAGIVVGLAVGIGFVWGIFSVAIFSVSQY